MFLAQGDGGSNRERYIDLQMEDKGDFNFVGMVDMYTHIYIHIGL